MAVLKYNFIIIVISMISLTLVKSYVSEHTSVTIYPSKTKGKENSDITFTCSHKNTIEKWAENIIWEHKDATVITGPCERYLVNNNETSGLYSLTIRKLKETDTGSVSCTFEEGSIKYKSADSRLEIVSPPIVEMTVSSQNAWEKGSNNTITLTCSMILGIPRFLTSVRWYREGEIFAETGDCSKAEVIDGKPVPGLDCNPGAIITHSIIAQNRKRYSCSGLNSYGWGRKSFMTVFPVEDKPGKAKLIMPEEAVIGTSYTLSCTVIDEGFPPAKKFRWYMNDKLIEGKESSNYQILSLSADDAGNYSCESYNTIGTGEGDSKVLVI